MISIIIPTYNRAKTLRASIISVLNQTYTDFELIIVDDNSTDNTEEIVNSIQDPRVKYIRHDKNLGANKARNNGILHSIGEYIAFQDSDDEWLPNKLEIQIKELIKSESDLVFCAFKRFINDKVEIIPSYHINENNILKQLLCENFISTQTILARRECLINEMFDDKLPRFQDWDLMIRIALKYKIAFINIPQVNVYVQEDSISKSREKAEVAMNIMIEKYNNLIEKDKSVISVWYKIMMTSSNSLKNKTKYLNKLINNNPFDLSNIYIYIRSSTGVIIRRLKFKLMKLQN